MVVPDNLKTAVTRAHRYEPALNRTHTELPQYYGFAVMLARTPRRYVRRVCLRSHLQPAQLCLNHFQDVRDTQEPWVTPAPELLIPPQQKTYLTPPVALCKPEGELTPERVRCPSLRGTFSTDGKRDLQAPWTPPRQKHFPPFWLSSRRRIPHGNQLAAKLPEAHTHAGEWDGLLTRQERTASVRVQCLEFLWRQDDPDRPDFLPDELPVLEPSPNGPWGNPQHGRGLLHGEHPPRRRRYH